MLHFDSIHPIVTRGSRFPRAPPHHIIPAFLNLYGRFFAVYYAVPPLIYKIEKLSQNTKFARNELDPCLRKT